VPVVINEVHVHLPTAITDAVAARLLVELERQIRRWRTDSGHEELEVPIHAGPRVVVVYTIAVDSPWVIESGRIRARPTSRASAGDGASFIGRATSRAASR
jgi:hypothetical protein